MEWLSRFAALALLLNASVCGAQTLQMKWGLENTWSYREVTRTEGQDAALKGKAHGKGFRAFAFNNDPQVVQVMLQCFERHNDAWDRYREIAGSKATREDFNRYKAEQDPFCVQNARHQAPTLYFDFVGRSNQQYVLQTIEVRTVAFSEYKGGGFADKQAWYDIILSHRLGQKSYDVEPRLVFSGTGRAILRFWSDNFYPTMGWMAPMGEYMLQLIFVFSTDKGEERVATDIFKMDV